MVSGYFHPVFFFLVKSSDGLLSGEEHPSAPPREEPTAINPPLTDVSGP